MFTGIIECIGSIVDLHQKKTNLNLVINAPVTEELRIDQSVSHNGVCLTVVDILLLEESFMVTAVDETLKKTTLGNLCIGDMVNLERSMLVNGRLDGHIVQGHVDQIGTCMNVEDQNGSWLFTFSYDPAFRHLIVEKGSICVNGVSLTAFNTKPGFFSVAIIPYTYKYTNFNSIKEGSYVNLEFDIIGKYVKNLMQAY